MWCSSWTLTYIWPTFDVMQLVDFWFVENDIWETEKGKIVDQMEDYGGEHWTTSSILKPRNLFLYQKQNKTPQPPKEAKKKPKQKTTKRTNERRKHNSQNCKKYINLGSGSKINFSYKDSTKNPNKTK